MQVWEHANISLDTWCWHTTCSAPGIQVYGYQGIGTGCQSEQLLGQLVKQHRATPDGAPLVVATKFFTVPWTNLLVGGGLRIGRQSMVKALRASLQRLGLEKVDLWQVGLAVQLAFFTPGRAK